MNETDAQSLPSQVPHSLIPGILPVLPVGSAQEIRIHAADIVREVGRGR